MAAGKVFGSGVMSGRCMKLEVKLCVNSTFMADRRRDAPPSHPGSTCAEVNPPKAERIRVRRRTWVRSALKKPHLQIKNLPISEFAGYALKTRSSSILISGPGGTRRHREGEWRLQKRPSSRKLMAGHFRLAREWSARWLGVCFHGNGHFGTRYQVKAAAVKKFWHGCSEGSVLNCCVLKPNLFFGV